MKRFIDHIPAQILETAIMTQLPGLLAPAKVPGLSKATVRAIAGESKAKQQLRAELEQKLAVLKGGESICKRYAARLGAGNYSCLLIELILFTANLFISRWP